MAIENPIKDQERQQPEHIAIFRFFVDDEKVETTEHQLTGSQIKSLAGKDPTDLLELRHDGKKIPIGDAEPVEIKDGLHFITYPGGKDS